MLVENEMAPRSYRSFVDSSRAGRLIPMKIVIVQCVCNRQNEGLDAATHKEGQERVKFVDM